MQTMTLSVPEISCGHCVTAIRESVCALTGISAVDVDLAGKTVRVEGTAGREDVVAAIADAGYTAAS